MHGEHRPLEHQVHVRAVLVVEQVTQVLLVGGGGGAGQIRLRGVGRFKGEEGKGRS